MTGGSIDFDGVPSVLWTDSRTLRGYQDLVLDEIYPTSTISSSLVVWKGSKSPYQVGFGFPEDGPRGPQPKSTFAVGAVDGPGTSRWEVAGVNKFLRSPQLLNRVRQGPRWGLVLKLRPSSL